MRPTLSALCVILLAAFPGFAQDDGDELGIPQIRERIEDASVAAGERASLVGLLFSRGRDGEVALREILGKNGPGSEDVRREVLIRANVELLPVVLATLDDDAALPRVFYRFRTATLATSLATLARDGERSEALRRRSSTAIGWLRSRAAIDTLIALWQESAPGAREAFDAVLPMGFENPDAAASWWAARADQSLERVLAEALRGNGEDERGRLERAVAEHREWAKEALSGVPLTFVVDRGLRSVDAVVRGHAADVLGKRTQWTEAERILAANGIARSINDFPLDGDDPQSTVALISVLGAARLFTAELSAKDDRDALVKWIVVHVDSKTPGLRDAAIDLVGFLGGTEGVPALKRVFADGDPALKVRTLDALKRLGGPLGPWTEQALAQALDDAREDSAKVVQKLVALLGIVGNVDSVAILDRVLADSEDVLTRRFAAISIGQAGRLEGEARPLGPAAIESLLSRALIDAAPQVREQAANVLARAPASDAVRDAILAQLRVEKVSGVKGALARALREVASDDVLPDIARAAGSVPEVAVTLEVGVVSSLEAKRFTTVIATARALDEVGNALLAGNFLRRALEADGLPVAAALEGLALATPIAEKLVDGPTDKLQLADALALARLGAPKGEKEPFVARRLATLMRIFVELGRFADAERLREAFPADAADSRANVTCYRLEEARYLASVPGRLAEARTMLESLSKDGLPAETLAEMEKVAAELDGLIGVANARFERHLDEILTRARDDRFKLLLPGVRQGTAEVKKRFRTRLDDPELTPEATADLIARLRELFPAEAKEFEWAAADDETRGKAIGAWKTFLES